MHEALILQFAAAPPPIVNASSPTVPAISVSGVTASVRIDFDSAIRLCTFAPSVTVIRPPAATFADANDPPYALSSPPLRMVTSPTVEPDGTSRPPPDDTITSRVAPGNDTALPA